MYDSKTLKNTILLSVIQFAKADTFKGDIKVIISYQDILICILLIICNNESFTLEPFS